jgi:hypothetical protein
MARRQDRVESARAITIASWTKVATVDAHAPATAPACTDGFSFALVPMAPMVAALETNPPASPATGSPKLAPTIR